MLLNILKIALRNIITPLSFLAEEGDLCKGLEQSDAKATISLITPLPAPSTPPSHMS